MYACLQHIDTAGNYGSEEFIGEALSELLSIGAIKREDIFLTTKLETDQHAREAVEPALRESLRKLRVEWVDLYLVHWPITDKPGPTLQPSMQVRHTAVCAFVHERGFWCV